MIDLSTIEYRKALARTFAIKYSIDATLICAVIEHESSWNQYATRFEEAFYHHYIESMRLTATEAYTRSMSWGLMQIMGQTARERGFTGKFLAELTDPATGVDFGCRKLQNCLNTTPNERTALLHYNGGSDASYPDMVLQFKSKYV